MSIEWYDKSQNWKCCEFVFEEFKHFYLTAMFPNVFCTSNVPRNMSYAYYNIYCEVNLLNQLNEAMQIERALQSDEKKVLQIGCKEEIIKWIINSLLIESEIDNSPIPENDGM